MTDTPQNATEGSSESESHVDQAMLGPTPDNPSLSLKKRLKRAAFFDQRERDVAAGEAEPVEPDAGLPDAMTDDMLVHELLGLPAVIAAQAGPAGASRIYDLQVAQSDAPGASIANDVVAPLNAKLGQSCFNVGAVDGSRVGITFDPQCADGLPRGRLETNPPAGLYGAPPARQKSIIKNPDTLRKLV